MKLKNLFQMEKNRWVFAIVFSCVYSFISTIGPMVYAQDIELGKTQILQFISFFAVYLVINVLVFAIVPRLPLWKRGGRVSQFLDELSERRLLFFTWIFIFVLWIPAYVVFYPGVLAYDMISQVGSALNGIADNHHPIMHTWLIGVFLRFGDAVGFGYEFGIGLLALIQMVLLSYALARLVCLLRKKRVPAFVVISTALLSAIWYMNAVLSVTMIKDCLHAAFLVLFVCHFTEIITNPTEYCAKKSNLFLFPVISFLMCAFRNNGIHIYVFCFAVLLILKIVHMKKAKNYVSLIAAVILPILMYMVYTGPIFNALGVEQGQKREALCIPIQQLQRVSVVEKDNLTEEQTELMNYYIDNLEWMENPVRSYDPFMADYAKSCFYSSHYTEDPMAFWKFYIQLGLQYPQDYVMGFLSNTLGFWYPDYYEYSYVVYENYSSETFLVPLERKSIWNWQVVKDYYKSVCESEFWRDTPVVRLFFLQGYTVWFLLYALAFSWGKKDFLRKRLPIFLPLIGQYGIMLLSPMSSFRYAWPFYLMFPIAFIAIFGEFGQVHNKEDGITADK